MSCIIFLCGDVMLGRGVDQIQKYKNDPDIYESYFKNAKQYVPLEMKSLTEKNQGVPESYVWGDLLTENLFQNSRLKIINLETSVTTSDTPMPGKEVLYKMHPSNIGVITSAKINYCHMANNHVMDWGLVGLIETIHTFKKLSNTRAGGIGLDLAEASAPTISYFNGSRILIFSYGDIDSGIPESWGATLTDPGLNLISVADPNTKVKVSLHISKYLEPDDFVIVSIHWGSNWGYQIESSHEVFAHYLIDNANVGIIHGHSSHHFRPIEIYNSGLIFYGCGDLINDYETIDFTEHATFLSDISIAYFPQYDVYHKFILRGLTLVPYTCHNLQLIKISKSKLNEVINKLNFICQKYKLKFVLDGSYIKLVMSDKKKLKNKYLI